MSLSNPYSDPGAGKQDGADRGTARSGMLACIAVLLAFLVAIGMLVSQQRFSKLFVEFEIDLQLVTLIACSPVLPVSILAMAVAAIFVSIHRGYYPFANRCNGMLIVFSIIALAVYVGGIFSPLIQLISGLSK